ncbi:hypothetical protein TNCV_4529261 [Trichonephila clavipes]|uniref:Uncharacterized protein n=1 Tax=Trichonephila clavipes TaxID=2585209 RepID=A0A8X6V1C9_TRICX|nr:hypothetical protein TNCV_4529261 [Trichonephila clavipes]
MQFFHRLRFLPLKSGVQSGVAGNFFNEVVYSLRLRVATMSINVAHLFIPVISLEETVWFSWNYRQEKHYPEWADGARQRFVTLDLD